MDETLRRRLIGAAVLLSGSFVLASLLPDPQRTSARPSRGVVTYDLRTGQPLEPAPAPAPAPEPEQPAQPPEQPAQAAALPPRTLKVDETLGEPVAGWYVQIGSFESQSNARNVLQKLYGLGMPALIQSVAVGSKLWYRVRVGPYAGATPAEQALATVRKNGYPLAKLVKPDAASGRN